MPKIGNAVDRDHIVSLVKQVMRIMNTVHMLPKNKASMMNALCSFLDEAMAVHGNGEDVDDDDKAIANQTALERHEQVKDKTKLSNEFEALKTSLRDAESKTTMLERHSMRPSLSKSSQRVTNT